MSCAHRVQLLVRFTVKLFTVKHRPCFVSHATTHAGLADLAYDERHLSVPSECSMMRQLVNLVKLKSLSAAPNLASSAQHYTMISSLSHRGNIA